MKEMKFKGAFTHTLRCAALRCKCMLLLTQHVMSCAALRGAALHLYVGVFTHTLRCAALLNAAYDELRCAALLFEAASKKAALKQLLKAALLLKFCGVELHSAAWLLKVGLYNE